MNGRLKILYAPLQAGYTRNQESVLRLLAERGHAIHIAYPPDAKHGHDLPARLANQYPNVTVGLAPRRRNDRWRAVAWGIRILADFSRFLHPRYAEAPLLRARVQGKIEKQLRATPVLGMIMVCSLRAVVRAGSARLSDRLMRVFLALEEAVPPSATVDRFLRDHAPDVVVVTPLVNVGSEQVDWFRGSRRLGIRSALCVASWDNLTNKGLIRVNPERVYVWNEIQKREAVELHGQDPARVEVVGAQRFDEWFAREPSRSGEELRHAVGLDPERPYLLYLCSSPFVGRDEPLFVRRWLEALRAHDDEELRSVGVLVRPHPQNATQWAGVDLSALGNVAIWPRAGADPVDSGSQADFFDSLAHSIAVVGVNTTALIEAAIVGKSAYTVLAPEFEGTQEGTLHFHYLRQENGGFLHEARTLPEHFEQLGAAMRVDAENERERLRHFVESFVRPCGLDTPCTPVLADAIEALGRTPAPRPAQSPWWAGMARALISACLEAQGAAGRLRPARVRQATVRALLGPGTAPARAYVLRHPGLETRLRPVVDQFVGPPADARSLDDVRVKLRVRSLRKVQHPRIVGPWTGPLMDELLLWLPLLRWLRDDEALDPARDIVLGRSESAFLYAGLCAEYRSSGEGSAQPVDVTSDLVESLYGSYLAGQGGIKNAMKHAVHERLPEPAVRRSWTGDGAQYVAACFGTSVTHPDREAVVCLAQRVVRRLAERTPVVLVGDQARELGLTADGERVIDATADTPRGLGLQARAVAISRARGVVGTWGGLSLLAPCYGVPALVVGPTDAECLPRVDLATRIARDLDSSFAVIDSAALELVAQTGAGLAAAAPW